MSTISWSIYTHIENTLQCLYIGILIGNTKPVEIDSIIMSHTSISIISVYWVVFCHDEKAWDSKNGSRMDTVCELIFLYWSTVSQSHRLIKCLLVTCLCNDFKLVSFYFVGKSFLYNRENIFAFWIDLPTKFVHHAHTQKRTHWTILWKYFWIVFNHFSNQIYIHFLWRLWKFNWVL